MTNLRKSNLKFEAGKWMNPDLSYMNGPWANINLRRYHAFRLRFSTFTKLDHFPGGTDTEGGVAGVMAFSTSFKSLFDRTGFKALKRSMPEATPFTAARR